MNGAWINSQFASFVQTASNDTPFSRELRISSVWWFDVSMTVAPIPPPGRYRLFWKARELGYRAYHFRIMNYWVRLDEDIIQEQSTKPQPVEDGIQYPRVVNWPICEVSITSSTSRVQVGFREVSCRTLYSDVQYISLAMELI
jgi:hypothetical protein